MIRITVRRQKAAALRLNREVNNGLIRLGGDNRVLVPPQKSQDPNEWQFDKYRPELNIRRPIGLNNPNRDAFLQAAVVA